jgi:preprotein translocase subunit SecF
MELFKHDAYFDFMRLRRMNVTISLITFSLAIGCYFFPGPNWGLDFKGGTEIQLAFRGNVTAAELRSTMSAIGHTAGEVVSVEGKPNEYIVRIGEVSALSAADKARIHTRLLRGFPGSRAGVQETKFSPGGDKISLRLSDSASPDAIRTTLVEAGARVRENGCVRFGSQSANRYECALIGIADEVIAGLHQRLGERAPEAALRVEWVGPKAGAQLRDSAIKSLLFAMALIMVYIAFRFDLRFAPGAVIAMFHDAVITAGILILLRKEFTLTTVAALLTIVGYSVNDTIVVYDRIRENLGRLRGKSMVEVINVSTSQTLSRTILTSVVTAMSVLGFLIWGTPVIRDFAETMIIGIVIGTYSSIYVAAPVTEWLDRHYFSTAPDKSKAPARRGGRAQTAKKA